MSSKVSPAYLSRWSNEQLGKRLSQVSRRELKGLLEIIDEEILDIQRCDAPVRFQKMVPEKNLPQLLRKMKRSVEGFLNARVITPCRVVYAETTEKGSVYLARERKIKVGRCAEMVTRVLLAHEYTHHLQNGWIGQQFYNPTFFRDHETFLELMAYGVERNIALRHARRHGYTAFLLHSLEQTNIFLRSVLGELSFNGPHRDGAVLSLCLESRDGPGIYQAMLREEYTG